MEKMELKQQRMKELFDVVECFSKINAYDFTYKPKALMLYGEKEGVDEGENVGVLAQELASNPITENTVVEDENGTLQIETNKLTAAEAAVLSDVCKRLLALEEEVEKLRNGIK